ncbi:MAG: HNH endonuclease, partial [Xenococcaceae cyanobacterium]
QGKEYQVGVQYGFSHLRQYILHRDGHKCQNPDCKNKSKQPILQVHHIGFWKQDRTDRPGNLITLCHKCHTTKNHLKSGFLYGWEPKTKGFKPETFMSTVKVRLVKIADGVTWGCITKIDRNELGIDKTHHNDAFVIAGGEKQTRCTPKILEQIRRHKRSMEQFYDAKYWDTRDVSKKEKVKPGAKLCSGRRTRNKNKNGENLRVYRGHLVSKGQRRIKTKRYPYKQGNLVRFEGRIFEVIGMQNKGKGVKIANYPGVKNKVVKPSLVESVQKRGGICDVA